MQGRRLVPGIPYSTAAVLRDLDGFEHEQLLDRLCEMGLLKAVLIPGKLEKFYSLPASNGGRVAASDPVPVPVAKVRTWLTSRGSGDIYDYMSDAGIPYGTAWHHLKSASRLGAVVSEKVGRRSVYSLPPETASELPDRRNP